MRLEALQRAFAGGVMAEADAPAILPVIKSSGLTPQQRLQIYRNNTFLSLTDALMTTFPVVCALVDARFFRYAADAFIRAHPPRSGDLHAYGGDFAEFLAEFPPCAGLPYLPDVARLEWAWQEAYHAANAAPLTPEAMAAIPPEAYAMLRMSLHPACRIVSSAYPLYRIWAMHQPEATEPGPIAMDSGGEIVLIVRPALTVEVKPLSLAENEFLRALDAGHPLAAAFERATAADAGFDFTAVLQRHILGGTFHRFRTNEGGEAS